MVTGPAVPDAARLFEGLTAPAFLCRPDAGVVAANGPAGALLAEWAQAPFDRSPGDLVTCLNAVEAGCGHGPRCTGCPIRAAIRCAAAGQRVERLPVAMVMLRQGRPRRLELRITAAPASLDGRPFALVALEPSEWVP